MSLKVKKKSAISNEGVMVGYIDGQPISLRPKQIDFIFEANKTYNLKVGATGSGKTFLDYFIMIPNRLRNLKGNGKIFFIGNTQSSILRNVIDPLRDIHGDDKVSHMKGNNELEMFGKTVTVVGAAKSSGVVALQGATAEYIYGDEVATWSPAVFKEMHARLRLDNSIFDGTCNPAGENHWLKEWIDEHTGEDLYHQHYTLDDGALSEEIKARLKRQFGGAKGGAHYDRYILGLWRNSEGLVYPAFASDPNKFLIDKEDLPSFSIVSAGVDFASVRNRHAFVITGIPSDYSGLYIIASKSLKADMLPSEVADRFVDFVIDVEEEYGITVGMTYADYSNSSDIRALKAGIRNRGLNKMVKDSYKDRIANRIKITNALIGDERLYYTKHAETAKEALLTSVWSDKDGDKRLEDDSTDIDTLDAFEYSFSTRIGRLSEYVEV